MLLISPSLPDTTSSIVVHGNVSKTLAIIYHYPFLYSFGGSSTILVWHTECKIHQHVFRFLNNATITLGQRHLSFNTPYTISLSPSWYYRLNPTTTLGQRHLYLTTTYIFMSTKGLPSKVKLPDWNEHHSWLIILDKRSLVSIRPSLQLEREGNSFFQFSLIFGGDIVYGIGRTEYFRLLGVFGSILGSKITQLKTGPT